MRMKDRVDTDQPALSESKEEGKDQESIQSSTTPDPGHHVGKRQKHNKTPYTREPIGQPPPRWPTHPQQVATDQHSDWIYTVCQKIV